jgi:hypothetical protein
MLSAFNYSTFSAVQYDADDWKKSVKKFTYSFKENSHEIFDTRYFIQGPKSFHIRLRIRRDTRLKPNLHGALAPKKTFSRVLDAENISANTTPYAKGLKPLLYQWQLFGLLGRKSRNNVPLAKNSIDNIVALDIAQPRCIYEQFYSAVGMHWSV